MSNHILIRPQKGWLGVNFKELYQYRELIGFLAHRDIMSQYKQAFFGVAWAVIKPIFAVLAFTLVFGRVAKLSSSGVPYPLFVLCGVTAWAFFISALQHSTMSLVKNTNLVTKIYFPRLILPVSSLGRGLVDFIISFILFIILFFIYGYSPQKTIILFPLFLFQGLCITLGAGFFFSALTVRYRDLEAAVPVIAQWWFWITPVAYGLENIPGKLKIIFFLNPMTWIIQGFRWSLLGVGEMHWQNVIITGLFSLLVLVLGLYYFRRTEGYFADII